jgi:AcrR family transcriptional regulator
MSRTSNRSQRAAVSNPDAEQNWNTFLADLLAKSSGDSRDRKQERSRRREQEILRAAIRVFARDGISRARIGDIASEAGMPVSSLYDYFPSKEELAYGVPKEHLGRFFAEFSDAVRDKRTFRERLRLYLWLAADFARRNPEWARTLYLEIWPSVLITESPVRHSIDEYVRVIVHMIREGAANKEWAPESNPYDVAAILNGSVNQIIIVWLLYRKPRDLMKGISSVVDRAMTVLVPFADASAAKPVRASSRSPAKRRPARG